LTLWLVFVGIKVHKTEIGKQKKENKKIDETKKIGDI